MKNLIVISIFVLLAACRTLDLNAPIDNSPHIPINDQQAAS